MIIHIKWNLYSIWGRCCFFPHWDPMSRSIWHDRWIPSSIRDGCAKLFHMKTLWNTEWCQNAVLILFLGNQELVVTLSHSHNLAKAWKIAGPFALTLSSFHSCYGCSHSITDHRMFTVTLTCFHQDWHKLYTTHFFSMTFPTCFLSLIFLSTAAAGNTAWYYLSLHNTVEYTLTHMQILYVNTRVLFTM